MWTFTDKVKDIASYNEQLALKVAIALMEYADNGTIPDDPEVRSQIRWEMKVIDKWREISEKKSTAMKGNKNALKTYQKQSKQKKTKENSEEQNETEKTEKWKIKNKKENNISLSNDNESASTFWDEEINECMEIIKSYNNGIINGSDQKWRQYSKHLIWKLKKIENVQEWKIKRQEVLKMILEIWKNNEYYSTKTTSPELIYYNLSTLMEVCRKQYKKQQIRTFTAL